ncbi:protein maelstrom homolog [Haliotis rubra]|uniref:protein maelstrom homolog n=1 Tax=Haliotis rubra TaxID=36100 RepID=UPI001EE55F73|nr:protein maelstrom homolog [Haliotis rubra]
MPKKKQAYNAFYFFMKEMEPQLRREGRITNGMADVVPLAHPRWQVLPKEEKERYEQMAKQYKAKMRGTVGDQYRMDNVGNIIAHRKDPKLEESKRIKKGRDEVVASWKTKDVMEEYFYFINFQVLCRTEDGDYLPCEIAVIEYNLQKGITKKLHRFIEPGRIPTGYRYTCMTNSDETHQIPVENFELSDENYRGLWIQLENFINPSGEKPDYPPVYCLTDSYEKTAYCLEWICNHTCLGTVNRLRRVYDLGGLVGDLYSQAGKQSISMTSISDMLTSSSWDYVSGTRCDWHEEKECNFCALATVQRYAYAISDAMSQIYNFKLTEKHLPCSSNKPSNYIIIPPSAMSIQSRPARATSRGRGWTPGARQGVGRGVTTDYSQQQRQLEEEDEEEEAELEDYKTRVRRPKMPAASGWGPVPGVNSTPNLDSQDASQWPSLGGGPGSQKFAGRVQPPDASSAPPPPLAWQAPGVGLGRGAGQGCSISCGRHEGYCRQPFHTARLPATGCRKRHATSASDKSAEVQPPRMALPPSTGLMGQGRGIRVPGQGVTQPPVGRGYAPPVGRGYAPVGRGYAPPVGRGYAPVGRGYAPPVDGANTPPGMIQQQMQAMTLNQEQ